ncbi:hypothetical protein UCDDA912_g02372 [Diaporthe ampelina]|uniref:AB hydrolase-1 domain-containing protein n=1 Tax=Diaporthe ampelina TaxID=1214573 RepID=A0A0G2FTW6_9PEZI|nr:hypothetical protein UCDDA912_g02372 [Diaporthe ampelina]
MAVCALLTNKTITDGIPTVVYLAVQFDLPRVDSNIDAVDWVWDLTTWSNWSENGRVTGVIPVNDTFTISVQLYWDIEIDPEDYSYVGSALRHGYSILTYDRLEVAGALCDDTSALESYTPRKIIHVGHSYGSFMTSGLLSRHGNLSDGAILTALLTNERLLHEVGPEASGYEFAAECDPDRFADR